jgi:deoxyribodipyrimidine photo-lyase
MIKMVKHERITVLQKGHEKDGPVIYWMSRDQRSEDNWALLYAQELALAMDQYFAVVFCLAGKFAGAGLRQYDFMLKGLAETETDLKKLNIPFFLLMGNPPEKLACFIEKYRVSHVVTDFDPLHSKQEWKRELCRKVKCGVYEVDSHNIVPCRTASLKCEFGAYTIRPKIKKLLPYFLEDFPPLLRQKHTGIFTFQETDWKEALNYPSPDLSVKPVQWLRPGCRAAKEVLNRFLESGLKDYNLKRNDPNESGTSNLSPYLHFGNLSAQRIALTVITHFKGDENTESFLEELIIRRELSDNYCFYNLYYDSAKGFPDWAKKSLGEHAEDEREYLYDFETFEKALTHDPLWNAAQKEMLLSGKMHGYMRMYWAKKILEWTNSPEEALDFSIRLNDKYQLDGRDPNGYTGCAWSVGGVHDRAWTDRPVFGKIRYMNYNGCKRKFDVKSYTDRWLNERFQD